jgi:hypothetical protein
MANQLDSRPSKSAPSARDITAGVLRNLGGAECLLFARCASVWGRASIDWNGGDGTRDSGDTTSQGESS